MLLDDFDFADFPPEVRSNTGISIDDDASWEVKTTFNMFKKQLYEICNCTIILNEYKQHVFDNITYYD